MVKKTNDTAASRGIPATFLFMAIFLDCGLRSRALKRSLQQRHSNPDFSLKIQKLTGIPCIELGARFVVAPASRRLFAQGREFGKIAGETPALRKACIPAIRILPRNAG
jgi:hypothetical protein